MGIFGEKNVYITIDRSGVRARLENGKTEVFKTGEVKNIQITPQGPTVSLYTTKGFKNYQVKQGYESLNRMIENTKWGANPSIEQIFTVEEQPHSSEPPIEPNHNYYEEPAETTKPSGKQNLSPEENANEEIKNMFNAFQNLDKKIAEANYEDEIPTMNHNQAKMATIIILAIFFIFFIFPILFTIIMTIIIMVFSAP